MKDVIILLAFIIGIGIICNNCNKKKPIDTTAVSDYYQKQLNSSLDDMKNKFQGKNITAVQDKLYIGDPVKYCESIPKGATLGEIGKACYFDFNILKQASNANFGGIKLLFDLSARANGIIDVNTIQENQEFCIYGAGCFDFYIPDINGNDLVANMVIGRIKFIQGAVK